MALKQTTLTLILCNCLLLLEWMCYYSSTINARGPRVLSTSTSSPLNASIKVIINYTIHNYNVLYLRVLVCLVVLLPNESRIPMIGLKSFTLPIQFSVRTMTAITSENGIVTQKSHTEIIQTLAGEIWRHTKYPSSNAYNIVCTRLITEFLNLADDDETWIHKQL